MALPITELIPKLLTEQYQRYVPGFHRLLVKDDLSEGWLRDFDKHTHTTYEGRLRYVQSIYYPEWIVEGKSCTFKRGCLLSIGEDDLVIRHRSEYIPKLVSDVLYARSLVGYRETFYLTIPVVYIRARACIVIEHWAQRHNYPVHQWITHQAHLQKRKFKTPEDAIQIIRLVERRWLLRYFVLTKKLSPEDYIRYKSVKMGRRESSEPLVLSTGDLYIQKRKRP